MAGRTVRLTVLALAAVAGWGCRSKPQPPVAAHPNVLFITVDSLRADHLGVFGYPRDTSPAIDALAREGVLFTRAIAQATWTFGSVPSFVTSRYPQSHRRVFPGVGRGGERPVGGGPIVLLGAEDVTFPRLLRAAGYRTALVTDHAGLRQIVGLSQGFDVVEATSGRRSAAWVGEAARAQLRALVDRPPFFLWAYFNQLHYPYLTDSPLGAKFQGDGKQVTGKRLPFSDERFGVRDAIPAIARIGNHQEVDFYVAAYDGCLAAADQAIGELLGELAALGLDRSTVVVLNADHGELLGEEGFYFTHGAVLTPANIHVPLLFRLPNILARGTRVGGTVSLLDLAPTVLSAVGVDARPMAPAGKNLTPCFTAPEQCERGEAFSAAHRARQFGVVDDRWLYRCENGVACGLFAFPGETGPGADRSAGEPAAVADLSRRLADWTGQHPGEIEERAGLESLDDETIAVLRELGYLR